MRNSYNPANQINQIAELTQTKNFSYDNVDRLTAMTNGTANESYNFDSVGNRTSSHLSASYNYQPFNRLVSTENSTSSYNYDANGNMVSKSEGKELWRYVWDYENRMTTASTRKQTVRYRYDALGRRVQRYFVGGKENTKFIYDGLDVVADDNSGVLTKYQNGLGIDNKLKMVTSGTASYFLADHLGSTVGLTDSSGAITESANYDSFGNATGNLSTRYLFTGREFDNFTGLHYYRARWYDGNLGRFISEDPIGFGGGDVNLYGYVWNSPIKLVDPSGLDGGASLVLGGGAAIGAGGAIGIAAAGAAIGAGIGAVWYYSWQLGEYIARRNYPEQFPDTQTQPETCSTKSKPSPQPAPSPQVSPTPLPMLPPTQSPNGRRGRYTCLVRCNIQKSVNASADCPNTVEDYGHGNSEKEAADNGELACKANFRAFANGRKLGCQTRHCHPIRCWRN